MNSGSRTSGISGSRTSGNKLPGRLDYFSGFQALGADPNLFPGAIDNGFNALQIRKKSAATDTGYALPDTAFFLRKTASGNSSSCNRFFSAYVTNFCHGRRDTTT